MDKRKIISLGRSSLVISLPKNWMELTGLKQGDSVSTAIQRDRSLVVFPGSRETKEARKITLHIEPDEMGSSIARRVIACYLNGCFGVKLASKKKFTVEQQEAIRDISGKLYMRIMEFNSKYIYIETLIDETKASIDSAVQRMHTITASMYRDALNSLGGHDKALARFVYSSDDDVDRFFFFILRLIRSILLHPELSNRFGLESVGCLDYKILVHRIEQVADRAADIAKNVILLEETEHPIPDPILELILKAGKEVFGAYDRAVKAFFSKDVDEANKVAELEERILRLDKKIASKLFLSKTADVGVCCSVCSMRDNIRGIMANSVGIAKITINRSYEEV